MQSKTFFERMLLKDRYIIMHSILKRKWSGPNNIIGKITFLANYNLTAADKKLGLYIYL